MMIVPVPVIAVLLWSSMPVVARTFPRAAHRSVEQAADNSQYTDNSFGQTDDDFSAYYDASATNERKWTSGWATGWNFGLGSTAAPTTALPTPAPTTPSPTSASPTPAPTTAAPTSASPTLSPTTASPTVSPTTASPTASPTLSCQDNADYRDPITSYPCEEFIGQECLLGVFFGMSTDQVSDLLENCPRSCSANLDCAETTEPLVTFQVQTSFRIMNGVFMGEQSIASMEEATTEYLTRYLRSRRVRAIVYSTQFLYEEKVIVEDNNGSTSLQQPTNILQVTLSFEGASLDGSDPTTVMAGYINQGLLNNAYSTALRYTGDEVFDNVYISLQSSSGATTTTTKTQQEGNRRSSSQQQGESSRSGSSQGPPSLIPGGSILALSSAFLVAATGYALQVMYRDDKNASKNDDDNDDGNVSTTVIDVTEYYSTSDEYLSFDDVAAVQSSKPPVSGGYRAQGPNPTFDSYLDYDESVCSSSSFDHRHDTTRGSRRHATDAAGHIPEVTFVDSETMFDLLRYDGEQGTVIMASESNISESLKMFVQSVGGKMDAAIDDIHGRHR